MNSMRVVRNDMIGRRQAETERTSKEERAKHDSIVDVSLRIMLLCVRIIHDR